MNRSKLAEIRARAEKATPGPWGTWEKSDGQMFVIDCYGKVLPHSKECVRFLASSRTDIPALCDALERANEVIKSMRDGWADGRDVVWPMRAAQLYLSEWEATGEG